MHPLTKFICCFFVLLIHGQLNAQTEKVLFDKNWTFALGHATQPEKDFNFGLSHLFAKTAVRTNSPVDKKFVDTLWRKLDLPHDWAVELPFSYHKNFDVESHGYKPVGVLYPETSVGWYRKTFQLPASDSLKRIRITFDGVFRDASFYVNGFYLGNHKSGYIGKTFDITDFLEFGKENVIVVRVDATDYEGWFYEGAGIYRHVWLEESLPTYLPENELFIHSAVSKKEAIVHIQGEIKNEGNNATPLKIKCSILDRSGKIIATKESPISVNAFSNASFTQKMTVPSPHLWSIDDPYLYKVKVSLVHDGKIISERVVRHGIRTIEIKPNGVYLNNQHIKIKGVNCHQDHAGVGSALPDALQYHRITLLKKMGANAYRSSHHAPTPELLDACDSLGMLVMDEQRLMLSSEEYLQQFEALVKRDRNHPSVFMWCIGNEEGWIQTTPQGKKIATTYIQKLKELDPYRTCTYAADLPNVHKGINEVIPVRGFNYRQFAVADYHKDHPTQPIIGTEMGSTVSTRGVYERDSIRGYLPDQDIHAPWWASRAEEWWPLAAENDYWLGGFIWTGFDYRGEPTPFKWPNINSHFGVMDMCGFPKNLYYYYQSWWTDHDVLHISPHWNWTGKQGQPIDVWVNSNADNLELFLNGKTLGKKDMPRNGHLKWTVPYQPGTLEAIAYKKGKKLTAKMETTGHATQIVLTPYKTTMMADGRDLSIINVSVHDQYGRDVLDADHLMKFEIKGAGKIIGVGNGDPSSHEPDKCMDGAWQRRLFNGKCQLIVQAADTAGVISLDVKSTGMWNESTSIVTIAPGNMAAVTNDPTYHLTGESAKPRMATKMLGADISFLPELEADGIKFSDKGKTQDAIEILKQHGFNYVRLRIFNDPAKADGGYSPGKGYCDLAQTLAMAKRVKAAGMKLLLDFHYSDFWADPGKQYKPKAWENLPFDQLKSSLYDYTKMVITALKSQGTLPDMVQVGNEINHGMVWPEGNIQHPDSLAQLFQAGVAAVKSVDPNMVIMFHLALGGQHDESVLVIDEMLKRKVHFDIIGLSYYPRWHGTLEDLNYNMNNLIKRYNKEIIVVEYSAKKREVNKLVFELPDGKGLGTCIWEPLSTWEKIFEHDGKSNSLLDIYDELKEAYLKP
jgi:beta-galactosidase